MLASKFGAGSSLLVLPFLAAIAAGCAGVGSTGEATSADQKGTSGQTDGAGGGSAAKGSTKASVVGSVSSAESTEISVTDVSGTSYNADGSAVTGAHRVLTDMGSKLKDATHAFDNGRCSVLLPPPPPAPPPPPPLPPTFGDAGAPTFGSSSSSSGAPSGDPSFGSAPSGAPSGEIQGSAMGNIMIDGLVAPGALAPNMQNAAIPPRFACGDDGCKLDPSASSPLAGTDVQQVIFPSMGDQLHIQISEGTLAGFDQTVKLPPPPAIGSILGGGDAAATSHDLGDVVLDPSMDLVVGFQSDAAAGPSDEIHLDVKSGSSDRPQFDPSISMATVKCIFPIGAGPNVILPRDAIAALVGSQHGGTAQITLARVQTTQSANVTTKAGRGSIGFAQVK